MSILNLDAVGCPSCDTYFGQRNVAILVRATLAVAKERGESTGVVTTRFINGLHARHLAGKSIEVDTVNRLGLVPEQPTVRPYIVGERRTELFVAPDWRATCPECKQGKHGNCTGRILDETDDWAPCACQEAGHIA